MREQLIVMSKQELLDLATQRDLKYRTRMSKDELIEGLVALDRHEVSPVVELAKARKKTRKSIYENGLVVGLDPQPVLHREKAIESQYMTMTTEKTGSTVIEQVVESAKFMNTSHVNYNDSQWELPSGYNDNKVVAMVVDPVKLYTYWEIPEWKKADFFANLDYTKHANNRFVVRLYDITDIDFNGHNQWTMKENDITNNASNWYFEVTADRSYCVEVGVHLNDGSYHIFSRSNVVRTPRDTVSDIYDEEWMMLDINRTSDFYDSLYRLSGGDRMFRHHLNSAWITEKNQKTTNWEFVIPNLNSESLSSSRLITGHEKPKDFWLKVGTELIVYGATEKDAHVMMNGHPIALDAEGRFRFHMPLYDETKIFDIHALSADKTMQRAVKPIVNRVTQ